MVGGYGRCGGGCFFYEWLWFLCWGLGVVVFGGGLVVVCFLLAKLQITPSKFGQNSIQSSKF